PPRVADRYAIRAAALRPGPGLDSRPSARQRLRMLRSDDPAAIEAPAAVGHNGGPPLDDEPRTRGVVHYCGKQAHRAAWRNPGREIMLRRLKRAAELGLTYREYTAVILDRGVYL